MITRRRQLGDLAEEIANNYLNRLGQRTLVRNWTTGHLEVDIITLDAKGLHFVEVKARTLPSTADPLDHLTLAKQRNLALAASRYISQVWKGGDIEAFFDVVTVTFGGDTREVNYYPEAFFPVFF